VDRISGSREGPIQSRLKPRVKQDLMKHEDMQDMLLVS